MQQPTTTNTNTTNNGNINNGNNGKDRNNSFDAMISKADSLLAATDNILSDNNSNSNNLLPDGPNSSSSGGAIVGDRPSTRPVIFNLVNAVVGAGVLAQPYCFKEAGMVAAGMFLCTTALFTQWSLFMMAYVGEISNKKGYSEAVEFYFGAKGAMATDFFIAFLNFGTSIAYIDVIGDIICGWLGGNAKFGALLSVLIFILFPLCCIRTFDQLRFTSYLGSAIYTTFGIAVVMIYFSHSYEDTVQAAIDSGNANEKQEIGFTIDFARIIPIQTLAFACHTILFPVYSEYMSLKNATTKSFNNAVTIAIVLCCTLYLSIGIFGAMTFQSYTAGDILLNYSKHNGFFPNFLQAVFAVSLCFTYPLVVFPLRDSLDKMLMKIDWFENFVFNTDPQTKCLSQRWYAETVIVCLSGFCVAIVLPSIEVIFGITGALAGTTLCFIIPSFMYLKATNVYNNNVSGGNYMEAIDTEDGIGSNSRNNNNGVNIAQWRLRAKIIYYCSIPLAVIGFILILVDLTKEDEEVVSLCSGTKE